ncbi:MAG: NADH-quinone oxidoreductase subunit J, partial [Bacteroidetes bacterium]|nr:NADH-quinone oxidoreductase subunit J [Bacteroidota bacterium]
MISPAAFYGFAGLAVVLAVATIVHRNLFKSATLLAGFFFSLAALFITLDAEFLAVVQILIYVGAITVLIVFAVMLTSRINDEELTQFNSQRWLGVATGLGLLGVLAAFLMHAGWGEADGGSSSLPADPLALIGTALMSDFIRALGASRLVQSLRLDQSFSGCCWAKLVCI